MSDNDKKLKFILAMTKHGLKHFDGGGSVLGGPAPGAMTNATNPNTGFTGTIGGILGLNNNFQASSANVQAGANQDQLNNAYKGVSNALAGQQGFANALVPQGNQGMAAQTALSNQLAAQANGQGPNVAKNQLNQATGANVANQASLMAGQRGASGNVGLMARQAAQQGAQTQQAAAGQAATLGAQQQIAAQQSLAGLSANQIAQQGQASTNYSQAQQNEQNILQNANTSYNNANVGMQSNINNVNAQTSASNQNESNGIMGGLMKGVSSISSLFGAEGGQVKRMADGGESDDSDHEPEQSEISSDLKAPAQESQPSLGSFSSSSSSPSNGPSIPSTASNPSNNSNVIADSMGSSGGGSSGGGSGMGSLASLAMLAAAQGGQIHKGYLQRFAAGGISGNPLVQTSSPSAPQSFAGQWLNSSTAASSGPTVQATSALPAFQAVDWSGGPQKKKQTPMGKTDNASSNKNISGDDSIISGGDAMADNTSNYSIPAAAKGGMVKNLKQGGRVKADNLKEKAKVRGNSYSNDTIPAMLSEDEVVIPRDVMQSKDPVKNAAKFVQAILAKKRVGLKRK
jgi:hypothetical protein